jgi:hypothetical protein
MRNIPIILSILFLTSIQTLGQQAKTQSYKLVLGDYVFTTETSFETDTVNGNSAREYSYLFKNDRQIIKIPRRIDRVRVYNDSDPDSGRIKIDTVDQFEVNKIVDTISKVQLSKIIDSEFQIYIGSDQVKFEEAHLETIQANGKTSYTIDLQRRKIKDGKHAFEKVAALDRGGYLILHTIWFYDLKGNRHEIECNIAWRIE